MEVHLPTRGRIRRRLSDVKRKYLAANLVDLYQSGFKVIALAAGGKVPMRGQSIHRPLSSVEEALDFLENHPDANFGVVTGASGNLLVLDVDGDQGFESLRRLLAVEGVRLPGSPVVQTPRGMHVYFRCGLDIANSVGRLGFGLDVRGKGGYIVIAGSVNADGQMYRYRKDFRIDQKRIQAAPDWLVQRLTTPLAQAAGDGQACPPSYGDAALRGLCADLEGCPKGMRNDGLNRAAFKAGQLVGSGSLDLQYVESALSSSAAKIGLEEAESRRTLQSGLSSGLRQPRNCSTLLPAIGEDQLTERLSKLGMTDIDNAKRFSERYSGEVALTPLHGWLRYNGRRWMPDGEPHVLDCVMKSVKTIQDEAQFKVDDVAKKERVDFARRSSSRSSIENIMRLAQPALTKDVALFDQDKMLLNVANGTIDLCTGDLRAHAAQDCITKITKITYDKDARAPLFAKFLRWITLSDLHYMRFLQKVFGYCLTGKTDEQKFFFIIGSGGTGKSVLMHVLRALLGEYALQADMRTFLVKQYDNEIPEDIARLHGARVAVAAEANIDRQIDEAKIKQLTGQDPVIARKMRQNSFQFVPEFKLLLVAYHFPRVREAGDAFWRRVQVLPMDRRVDESNIDHQLVDKLTLELPGILTWAVRGCLAWQSDGLNAPMPVLEATNRWQGFADSFADYLRDRCYLEPSESTSSLLLRKDYETWCQQRGASPLTQSGFKIKLEERNLTHKHAREGNVWKGIRLK